MKTVLLDNYDSFTFNLYQYIGELDEPPVVVRNDAVTLEGLQSLCPGRIVISPGPGDPAEPAYFGVCLDAIRHFGSRIPILGICLGHQGIVHAMGGKVINAPCVMHGKSSVITHNGDPVFDGVPKRFEAMRYHSLVGDCASLPPLLSVIARTDDGVLMGVRHKQYPMYGLQFHPESIGTPHGKQILRNLLGMRPHGRD
jgi:anthranilate synthase/aminodeoxychorismate synthase-like glutamine amidotransferase